MSRLVSVVLLLALSAACAADLKEGRHEAKVEEAPAQPVAAAPEAPADPLALTAATVLNVDAAKSKLGAIGAKITAQHPITFHTFEGRVGLEGDQVAALGFRADVASLEADHPKLTAHLKDADFLDVAQFPHATFRSTAIEAGSDAAGSTHTVTGDLTIHGQTKRVTFPATITVQAGEVRATTEFTLDRRDFGVVYPGKPDDLVQDAVVLKVDFVAPRA